MSGLLAARPSGAALPVLPPPRYAPPVRPYNAAQPTMDDDPIEAWRKRAAPMKAHFEKAVTPPAPSAPDPVREEQARRTQHRSHAPRGDLPNPRPEDRFARGPIRQADNEKMRKEHFQARVKNAEARQAQLKQLESDKNRDDKKPGGKGKDGKNRDDPEHEQ